MAGLFILYRSAAIQQDSDTEPRYVQASRRRPALVALAGGAAHAFMDAVPDGSTSASLANLAVNGTVFDARTQSPSDVQVIR